FERDIQRPHVNIAREPTNNVNLSIHPNRAGMTEPTRHRRSLPPPIGRRIVLLHEWLIVPSPRRTPKHINLAVDSRDPDLTPRLGKPCLLRPSSLAHSLRHD